MARYNVTNPLTDEGRNQLNAMFEELYKEYTDAGINAKDAREKAVQAVADSLLAKDIAETTRQEMINIIREQTEGGDIVPEVVQARGNEATLGERLNSIDSNLAKTTKQVVQTNFVKELKNMQSFKEMHIERTSENQYDVTLKNNGYSVRYEFKKDNLDDFIKFYRGIIIYSERDFVETVAGTNFTGTWTTGTNSYTTQVGATFEATITGTEIIFKHYADNRGGLWEFVIDGDTANPIQISTYSESPISWKTQKVVEGLSNTQHTIVGTFKGDDPDNAPSGTARGWVYVQADVSENTFTGYNVYDVTKELLAEESNKEMAFRINDGTGSMWIPDHGTGTAFNVGEPIFLIDGKKFRKNELNIGENIQCESYSLIQDVYGSLPTTPQMCRIKIKCNVLKDGTVNFIGSFEALKSFFLTAGYPAMMPTTSDPLNEFVSGIGTSKVNSGDGSYNDYTDEKDSVYNVCAISTDEKDLFSAVHIGSPLKSMRLTKNDGKPAYQLFLWERSDLPKVYFQAYENYNIPAGEKYSWFASFLIGKVENVYDFVKDS